MTTWLGKSCSFGLTRVPFVNCSQFMYLVISLLVTASVFRKLRSIYVFSYFPFGFESRMRDLIYQFLIIAYLFTLPRNSVARLTDRARNNLKCVEGP